jgi:hypothetical protein
MVDNPHIWGHNITPLNTVVMDHIRNSIELSTTTKEHQISKV